MSRKVHDPKLSLVEGLLLLATQYRVDRLVVGDVVIEKSRHKALEPLKTKKGEEPGVDTTDVDEDTLFYSSGGA